MYTHNSVNAFQLRCLLIEGIDSEITGTLTERLEQVKQRFESEMLKHSKQQVTTALIYKRLQDWLQGLCNTVEVPFWNDDIIEFFAKSIKRDYKPREAEKFLDSYFEQLARNLYALLYTTGWQRRFNGLKLEELY